MIAAFWDYVTTTNPRLPLRLVTSDFSLAHVCVAERVPFLFARSPFDVWRDVDPAVDEAPVRALAAEGVDSSSFPAPQTLWFDPFVPVVRFCTAHAILWELCMVFSTLEVTFQRDGTPEPTAGVRLGYEPRQQLPGKSVEIRMESGTTAPVVGSGRAGGPGKGVRRPKRATSTEPASPSDEPEQVVQVGLASILEALPRSTDERVPLSLLSIRDSRSLKQLDYVGETTRIFRIRDSEVEAGPDLVSLLESLEHRDYVAVNDLFRRVPLYDRVLRQAEATGTFPSSRTAGVGTGWAVMLGAAFKMKVGARYGLAPASTDEFSEAVRRVHADLGEGRAAVQLPEILAKVCSDLRISPIRFEALLASCLGRGILGGYEAHRATVTVELPEHRIIVAPRAAEVGHFLRQMAPGRGILVGGILVSSLVRRDEGL